MTTDRIGMTSKSISANMMMTIIAYRTTNDIDVQFEDGNIAFHKGFYDFKRGKIANPALILRGKDHIGMEKIADCGLKMKIIEYRNHNDIDIKFEDGAITKHKTYSAFRRGQIGHPNAKKKLEESMVGLTNTAINGMQMKVIAYRNHHDIDVLFEDGTKVQHKEMGAFKKGQIKNPNVPNYNIQKNQKYIGETNISTSGQKMTIIGWQNTKNVTIQFEDGSIRDNVSYSMFQRGSVENPNFTYRDRNFLNKRKTLIGQSAIMKNGLKLTITDYLTSDKCIGEFEDHSEPITFRMNAFRSKTVKHPSGLTAIKLKNKLNKEGMEFINQQGLNAKIIEYIGTEKIKVRLESGYETYESWRHISNGKPTDPTFRHKLNKPFTYKNILCKKIYTQDKIPYFICECPNCGMQELLSPKEICNHNCTKNKGKHNATKKEN